MAYYMLFKLVYQTDGAVYRIHRLIHDCEIFLEDLRKTPCKSNESTPPFRKIPVQASVNSKLPVAHIAGEVIITSFSILMS